MKPSKLSYFIFFAAFLTLGAMQSSLSEDTHKVLSELQEVHQGMQAVGEIKPVCPDCSDITPNLSVKLDKKSLDLGKPLFIGRNIPYIIYLKRTNNSPDEVELNFGSNFDICVKGYVGIPYGQLNMGCQATMSDYKPQKITLDLKALPTLSEGKEEIIEIQLTKKDTSISKYSLSVKNLSDTTYKVKMSKTLISSGFSVNFLPPKRKGK